MASVCDTLRQPVDEVTVCPVLEMQDVSVVTGELETILKKCLYCIRLRQPRPLEIFLLLLSQVSALQPEKVCKELLVRAEEGIRLDLFCELSAQVLARVNAAFRLQFDIEPFFDVLQVVSGSPLLKERVGTVLGSVLIEFLADGVQHQDDHRMHRNCASAVITLLRGSKANKNRLSVECSRIAASLENATDIFFQMQCVEILFRLYVHNHTVLSQARMDEDLQRGIMELPNDATLLLCIQTLLDSYNAEHNASRIIPYTILRMEGGGSEICSHTTLYFSPLLLVVLLPGGTGDSFTIPYEHIRSVKLSKDHKLTLRLNTIPPKLSTVMQKSDDDTLFIFLTQSTLTHIRSSSVHQWIADRKRTAPKRVLQHVMPAVKISGRSDQAPREAEKEEDAEPVATSSQPASRAASGRLPISERLSNVSRPASSSSLKSSRPRDGDTGALDEIHRAAAIKADRYRKEQTERLQHTADQMREKMDEMRRHNARDRDSFEADFREDMTVIRNAEASLKASAAECVQALNAELEDVQALGALLKLEIDKLRERVAKSYGKSEGVEEASLVHMKEMVDTQMKDLDATMATMIQDGNPLFTVSAYIAQHMDDMQRAPNTGTKGKARRLEYT